MSQVVQDYVKAVDDAFAEINAEVAEIDADVTKLQGEIAALAAAQITEEDKAKITASLEGFAPLLERIKALNERTAPDAVPEAPEAPVEG